MADTSDVEQGLVALIAQASPAAKVFRGWPVPGQLDQDLARGVSTVSVYPSDVETKVTRHQPRWVELPPTPVTLAATADESTVTLSGTPASPLNVAVLVGNAAYVYPVQPGDTLGAIALGLAALIPGAANLGPTLTVPGTRLRARVGGVGTAVRELKRQKKGYQVTLWCPDPAGRDALGALVDAALAAADTLSLPDGTAARLLYERTRLSDRAEKDNLYRRDLFYSAEYSTTQSTAAARVVAELLNTAPDGGPVTTTAT